MFTGIIQLVGRIESLDCAAEGGRLRIHAPGLAPTLHVSSSIAANGCCLTIVEHDAETFAADLSSETLRRTSFGEMKPGRPVNLEQPLVAGAEIGGHFVQGHVDGLGRVARLAQEGQDWWLSVRVPEGLGRYVAEKGSMAVDGISLTVARWQDFVADFAIIPFTCNQTNLKEMTVGDAVNLECDILAKYVERLLESRPKGATTRLTVSKLLEEGF